MKAKAEWISTVLTIISVLVAISVLLFKNYTIRELIDRYREIILFFVFPVLFILFFTYLLSLIGFFKSANRVYISYCHADKGVADQIIQFAKESNDIKKRNINIISDNDIKMGENIEKSIKVAIENAGTIIIVISDKYMTSESCAKELQYIVKERARIIPIFLPSMKSFDNIPAQIKERKGVVLKQESSEDIHTAVDTIIKDIT